MTDPLVLIGEVERATTRLLATARGLDGAALAAPSLLPGWSRGHVLAHLARNADAGTNLLTWARTGVETPAYSSTEQRSADIEAGAGRPISEHLADLESAAARLAGAVAEMAPEAWAASVRWPNGRTGPAATVVWNRLRELEMQHVDLDAGYAPADWSDTFSLRLLHELCAGMAAPVLRMRVTDLGRDLAIGAPAAEAPCVSGPARALAGWLTGRGTGESLSMTPSGPLPAVPAWL